MNTPGFIEDAMQVISILENTVNAYKKHLKLGVNLMPDYHKTCTLFSALLDVATHNMLNTPLSEDFKNINMCDLAAHLENFIIANMMPL